MNPFVHLLVHLGSHINFSKSELHLTLHFSSLGLYWDSVGMSVSLPSDKLFEMQKLAYSLLQGQTCYSPSVYVLSGQDQHLCQWTCTTLPVVSFRLMC